MSVPGDAKPGMWTYYITNAMSQSQTYSINVVSRLKTPAAIGFHRPLLLAVRLARSAETFPSPMRVFATATSGGNPVLNLTLEAVVDRPKVDDQLEMRLADDGFAADEAEGDGIYSGFFLDYTHDGRCATSCEDDARGFVRG